MPCSAPPNQTNKQTDKTNTKQTEFENKSSDTHKKQGNTPTFLQKVSEENPKYHFWITLAQHKMWEQQIPNTSPDEQLKCDSKHKNNIFPWQTRLCAWLASCSFSNLFSQKKKLKFLAQTIATMYHFGHSVTKKPVFSSTRS